MTEARIAAARSRKLASRWVVEEQTPQRMSYLLGGGSGGGGGLRERSGLGVTPFVFVTLLLGGGFGTLAISVPLILNSYSPRPLSLSVQCCGSPSETLQKDGSPHSPVPV